MEKINLKNMPCGQLYEYSDGCYVWKVLRAHATRDGNYLTDDPTPRECTEVFGMQNDGNLGCVWSGQLITNPGVYNEEGLDANGNFSIFSGDLDSVRSFHQEHELVPAPLKCQISALEGEVAVLKDISAALDETSGKKM